MPTFAGMTTTTEVETGTRADWIEITRQLGLELSPGVAERDRTGALAVDGFRRMREVGITSALVPEEFGGGGVTHSDLGAILRELGRYDGPTAVALAMHSHLVAAQVWRHKHGLDASAVLRKVGEGKAVLISTGASDWLASNGTAEKVDGGYKISARKSPASGCEAGDILATSVRWDDAPEGPQVIHCSLPFSADGVRIELTWDTLGMRATGSHTVVVDNVFVPDAAVAFLRPADVWHPVWNTIVTAALPLIMSAYLGIADAAVDVARGAVAQRREAHVFQLVGEMLNAHTTANDTVAAMYADSDDLQFDNTDEQSSRTLSRKTVSSDAVIETVRLAIETVGGVGYTHGSELERLYRDVHGCLFHPLGRAKQTRLSGRVALGHSPIG
jgi:alkylation response protein AidB-like acyl-CoA dehydrogenase